MEDSNMVKKIIGLGLALVVLFSLVALSACDIGGSNPTLEEYQATAVTALETYAEGKGQANYTEANWTLLQSHVEAGRIAINEAETKRAVRTARDAAKQQIGTVPRESSAMNTFFTLQEAYNEGLITKEDLRHIMHFSGGIFEIFDSSNDLWLNEILSLPEEEWTVIERVDFTPQFQRPEVVDLNAQIASTIKNLFAQENDVPLGTVSIHSFLGEFNGSFAVRVTTSEWEHGPAEPMPEEILGMVWWLITPQLRIFN
jgi:hypothetical protein